MNGPDPEFEEFLKRRRPLFRRDVDDGLEPPPELDRIVLRQAREAIEGDPPMRVFRTPRWIAPFAIAATLVLGLAIVFKAGVPALDRVPEVTIENAAQRADYPAPPADSRTAHEAVNEAAPANAPVVVDLAPPPPPPALARGEVSRSAGAPIETATVPSAAATTSAETPAWRRDSKTWQAEIERLRASGDHARANAEMAEFNRQHRAYAVAPDR